MAALWTTGSWRGNGFRHVTSNKYIALTCMWQHLQLFLRDTHQWLFILFHWFYFTGGPGLEPPYRPRMSMNNPQKLMPTRPNYPGMISNLPGGMGMIGIDNKQYQIGFKPQPAMPQGQILRQQLQVRLVSLITDIKNSQIQWCTSWASS